MPILFFDFFLGEATRNHEFLGAWDQCMNFGPFRPRSGTIAYIQVAHPMKLRFAYGFCGCFCQFSGYFQPDMFGICFSWIWNCLGNSVFFSPFEIWAVVRAAIRKIWCLCGACGNWCPSEKPWNRLEQRERRKFPMRRNCVPLGHTWTYLDVGDEHGWT